MPQIEKVPLFGVINLQLLYSYFKSLGLHVWKKLLNPFLSNCTLESVSSPEEVVVTENSYRRDRR